MASVSEDPELILGLVAKELKAARLRIIDLESQIKNANENAENTWERAQAAEYASEILRKNYEDLSTENKLLRESLEELKDTKKPSIKKEQSESQPKLIRNMVDKSVSADEQNAVEMFKLQEKQRLEQALETYYLKYKNKKLEMKELTQTCKELERQITASRAEKDEAVRAGSKALQEATATLSSKNEITPAHPIPANPTWNELEAFMLNLPKVANFKRPQNGQLQPICHRSTDLKSLLASDSHTIQLSKNFLYLSDLLFWCSDMQSALAIGPIHVFDKPAQSWTKRSIFQNLYETTFSLFHQREEHVVYVGLYKAINLRQWAPDGSRLHSESTQLGELLRHKYASALAESTVIDNFKRRTQANSASTMTPTLKSFYYAEILNFEPLGLQNVGFDDDLYKKLATNYKSKRPSRSVVLLPEPTRVDSGAPTSGPHNKRKRFED